MSIHPTAIIDRHARIDGSADIGPFCVIEAHVAIGPRCRLWQNVYVTGWTTIDESCELHPGVVIGHTPQDIKHKGERSYCRIGARNIIREYTTIHRGTGEDTATEVGDDNFILGGVHIGHNCVVGNRVTMVNGSKLAGHCTVADRVTFGGDAIVHQFVRIGELAMIGAGAPVAMDVPPYMLVDHDGKLIGLNSVGLRRAGFPREELMALRRAFHALFRGGRGFRQAVEELAGQSATPAQEALVAFLRAPSRRGVLGPRRSGLTDSAEGT